MYIATIPNRTSPPAILLRESYRENGKVKNRTLANLSKLPPETIEALRLALAGTTAVGAIEIERALPHGHVAAVLGAARKLGIERMLGSRRTRERDLLLAMIVQRILAPASKLASARALTGSLAHHSLSEELELSEVTADELYSALDVLLARQGRIEEKLAGKHIKEGALVLYDLTSVWMEGRTCPLARRGYSRDGRTGSLQIEFGVLTDAEGCPVAVEVFEGNTADPATLSTQVEKIRKRFGIERVVLVGDRGMITDARIRKDVQPAGFDWITALRAPAIKDLVREGSIQLSLFEQTDLAEISHPDYPGERLVVCKNPLLADERARKRKELLAATENELAKIVAATRRPNRPLRGSAEIALRVGPILGRFRMRKHFEVQIKDDGLTYARKEAEIAAEAALDGIYIVRTNVGSERMDASAVVKSYKRLAHVERVFRSMKTVDLDVRPVFHRVADRVRAHVFLCLLAYYVRWHMEGWLAPLLFADEDPAAGELNRKSAVSPAMRSPGALAKIRSKQGVDGLPAQCFKGLMSHLATLTKNHVKSATGGRFVMYATPTPLQTKALQLLDGAAP